VQVVVGTESDGTGELSKGEYDRAVLDLVNFLVYSGDPVKLERHNLGWWVMAFLVLFTIVVVMLKKEYWRDVH
jgi:ubiquinol-cytochrome c reductase cytochrome c1 subunit